jgi:hypothetical protein
VAILRKRKVWRKAKPNGPARLTPDLTEDEQAHVRCALQALRRRHGSWAAVAAAMGVRGNLLVNVATSRKPSVGVALRAARVAGVAVEDVLAGKWPKPGSCPLCGRPDTVLALPGARS